MTILLNLIPDGNEPITETMTWLTDVQIARDGTELRAQARQLPRYKYEQSIVLFSASTGQVYNDYDSGLYALNENIGSDIYFPLWPHATFQTGLNTAGDVCFWNGEDYTAIKGKTTDTTPPGTTCIVPIGKGRLTEALQISHELNNRVASMKMVFELLQHEEAVPAMPYPLHASKPLFPTRLIDCTNAPQGELSKLTDKADFGMLWKEVEQYKQHTLSLDIALMTRADIEDYRAFILNIKGRLTPFYIQGPSDTEPQLYRLEHDAIGIQYIAQNVAKSRMTLLKVNE